MEKPTKRAGVAGWLRYFPPAGWFAEYEAAWLAGDFIAGVTLAAYAIPVSMAYAGLAGLPPQVASMVIYSAGWATPCSARRVNWTLAPLRRSR
jgi:Sulfate permease family